jgi:hypothetical protein
MKIREEKNENNDSCEIYWQSTQLLKLSGKMCGAEAWVVETGSEIARCGKKCAIVAGAHVTVGSRFHMLKDPGPHQDLGGNHCDEQRRHHLVDRLTRRLERLGW